LLIPETSREVLSIIAKQLDRQNKKGYETYGTTIDQAKDEEYDWNRMALEECIDALQYLVKRNKELEKENKMLRLNEQIIASVARKKERERNGDKANR